MKVAYLLLFLFSLPAHSFWLEGKIGQNSANWGENNTLTGPGVLLKFGPEVLNPIVFGPHLFYNYTEVNEETQGFQGKFDNFGIGPHITYNGGFFRLWVAFSVLEKLDSVQNVESSTNYGRIRYRGHSYKFGLGVNLSKNVGLNAEVQRKDYNEVTSSVQGELPGLEFQATNLFISLSLLL